MSVRKIPYKRSLWYHAESDCFVEAHNDRQAEKLAQEGCHEVTGDRNAERLFRSQKKNRRALSVDFSKARRRRLACADDVDDDWHRIETQ